MVGDDGLNSNLLVVFLYVMRASDEWWGMVKKVENTYLMIALVYSSEAAFTNLIDNDIRTQLLVASHPSHGRAA